MNGLQLSEYIRKLRKTIVKQQQRLNFLEQTETYLPKIDTVNYPYDDNQLMEIENLSIDYVSVTMTFDPRKFPQLLFTPEYYQQNYFKQIISKLIYTDVINAVYGCFEKHNSGIIHCHFIAPLYNTSSNYQELEQIIKPYLTDRATNNKAVVVKPTTNTSGWLNYINKSANYKEFFSYNMIVKKPLDL